MPPRLRRLVFWSHLATGLVVGLVVLLMSVTGVLLTYEKQLVAWADARAARVAPPAAGATRVPLRTIVDAARAAHAGTPTGVTVAADPHAAVAVAFGREATVFVDPYTGAVLGEGARGMRAFFATVTSWHRYVGRSGEHRTWGRAVTGASNLAFLFLVLSGAYLWVPRRWTRPQLRSVTWFRRGLAGKARDFNWHNVAGLWSALPLAVVVASAVVISYPWASDLVYRAVGEKAPARPAEVPPARAAATAVPTDGLDALLARAERRLPGWRRIQLQLPRTANAPVTFVLDAGTGGQPQRRAQLVLDRATGAEQKWEPFASQSTGRRLRSVLRFAHTGEVGGLLGQTVAGLASLGAVLLVWTGLSLAWRRWRAWRERGARDDVSLAAEPVERAA